MPPDPGEIEHQLPALRDRVRALGETKSFGGQAVCLVILIEQ